VVIVVIYCWRLWSRNVFPPRGHGAQRLARAQIEMLGAALDAYRLDVGRYPTTEEGLAALLRDRDDKCSSAGPYLRRGVPPDRGITVCVRVAWRPRRADDLSRTDRWHAGGTGDADI
jgi:general secretion pathway protein G